MNENPKRIDITNRDPIIRPHCSFPMLRKFINNSSGVKIKLTILKVLVSTMLINVTYTTFFETDHIELEREETLSKLVGMGTTMFENTVKYFVVEFCSDWFIRGTSSTTFRMIAQVKKITV